MDKVKQILELLRKHHFWILCGLSVLVGLIVWKMSTGDLEARFATDSGKIKSTLDSLKQASSAPDQPHDDWAAGQNKQTDAMKQEVRKAWEDLYKQQKELVFIWPKDDLGNDFVDEIKKTDGTKNEIPGRMLDRYLNTVRSLVAELPKIAESEPLDQVAQAGGGQPGPGAAAGTASAGEYKVNWNAASLSNIEKSFTWEQRPTTLLVRFAQEELWVYKALCKVIAAVNEGSGIGDAPVKEIQEMKIAYPAVELPAFGGAGQKRIFSLVQAAADAAPPAPTTGTGDNTPPSIADRGKSGDKNSGIFGSGAADPAAAPASPDAKWKRFRYVNAKGEPRPPEEIDNPPPEAAQYNMMPFALSLSVDDRYIDRLLVAFRNSTLPLEVQQVRINPQSASGGSPGGFAPAARTPAAAGGSGAAPQTRLVNLEIRGVAYLIKPIPADFAILQTAPNPDQPAPEQNPTPNPGTDQTPAPAPTPEPTQPGGAAGTTPAPPAAGTQNG